MPFNTTIPSVVIKKQDIYVICQKNRYKTNQKKINKAIHTVNKKKTKNYFYYDS